MKEVLDSQLISQYLKGDQKSLEILIQKYLKSVFGFVFSYVGNSAEAEDITQDVFLRMWLNIKKFKEDKNFKTWLFSIAKNAAIDHLKMKKAIPFSSFDDDEGNNFILDTIRDTSPLPPEIMQKKYIAAILYSAMNKLSAKYKTVLSLYYLDCYNFREIAAYLGESINTVKSRHRRGLVLLKDLL